MLKATTKTINGHEYTIAPFMARDALRKAVKMSHLLSPVMAGFNGDFKNLMDSEIDFSLVAKAILSLDADEVSDFVFSLFAQTHRDRVGMSSEAVFNTEYAGGEGLAEMANAMVEILKVNYGGFIQALRVSNPLA